MQRLKRASLAGTDVDDSEAYYNLVEEMVDVLICMEQLREIYGISLSEIQMMIDKKAARQEARLYDAD